MPVVVRTALLLSPCNGPRPSTGRGLGAPALAHNCPCRATIIR